MKRLALIIACLALPASAGAQELMLDCHYESVLSVVKGKTTGGPDSGAFSVIIHMNNN